MECLTDLRYSFEVTAICQVKKSVYGLKHDTEPNTFLEYVNLLADSEVQIHERASPSHAVRWPILVNWRDEVILSVGGVSYTGFPRAANTFSLYNVQEGSWSSGPRLLKVSAFHSCCVLGEFVYIFGGIGEHPARLEQ